MSKKYDYCPVCGAYCDNGYSNHHCSEKFLKHREGGLKSHEELGRITTPSFGQRLSDGMEIGHLANGEN